MKELFINEVSSKTICFLDDNQRIKLRETLAEICLNYQITIINRDNETKTNKNNIDILNKFISAKEIEGCSKRTLKYYKDNINKMLEQINIPINEITTEILRKYLAEYKKTHL